MREKEMDERERKRILREKELEADLSNASDLFGAASLDPSRLPTSTSSNTTADQATLPPRLTPFLALPSQIKTKADFEALSKLIYTHLIKPHTTSPQFASFVEQHTKVLCSTLKEGEVKRIAGGLNNMKIPSRGPGQGPAPNTSKKPKAPNLGGKGGKGKYDLTAYEDDDFGNDPDDFM